MAAGLQSGFSGYREFVKNVSQRTARQIGLAWERMPEPRPRVSLEIFNSSVQQQIDLFGVRLVHAVPK